jgi:uncharacterized protein YndB with AHSA1/START domain
MTNSLPRFTITRMFNAPVSLVWKAWTDPQMLAKWFGPKGTAERSVISQDLRVGGHIHSHMKASGGPDTWGKFIYQEVVPESRLSWLHGFSDESGTKLIRHPFAPQFPMQLLTVVTFTARGSKTEVTLTWEPHDATPEEIEAFRAAMGGMKQGWGGSFENLDEVFCEAKKFNA